MPLNRVQFENECRWKALCISCTAGITTHRLDLDSPFRRNSEEGFTEGQKTWIFIFERTNNNNMEKSDRYQNKTPDLKGKRGPFFFFTVKSISRVFNLNLQSLDQQNTY